MRDLTWFLVIVKEGREEIKLHTYIWAKLFHSSNYLFPSKQRNITTITENEKDIWHHIDNDNWTAKKRCEMWRSKTEIQKGIEPNLIDNTLMKTANFEKTLSEICRTIILQTHR